MKSSQKRFQLSIKTEQLKTSRKLMRCKTKRVKNYPLKSLDIVEEN